MSHQLLQSLSTPFYGILMMTPFVQSAGTSSPSHIATKSGCKMVAASSGSASKSSALRLSFLELKGFNCLDYLFFLLDRCVDVEVVSSCWNVTILFRWWSVQNLSEMFHPTFLVLSFCRQKGSLLVFNDGVGMSLILSTNELCYLVCSPLLVTFCCILCSAVKLSVYALLSALVRLLTHQSASLCCCW